MERPGDPLAEEADSASAAVPRPEPAAPRPLPPPPPPLTSGPRPVKAPALALVLSLFPGLGQLYNGQPAKAFTFFFAWVASIYGTAEITPFPFAFLIPFVYFYNLIDAWRTATLINARARGGLSLPVEEPFESPAWGATLLGLGLVLLLNNLGWLRLSALSRYWPMLLVAAGAVFVIRALRQRRAPRPSAEPFDDRPLL